MMSPNHVEVPMYGLLEGRRSAKRVDFGYNAIGRFTEIERFADLAGTLEVPTSAYTYDDASRITDLVTVTVRRRWRTIHGRGTWAFGWVDDMVLVFDESGSK